jgi:hypothetical protein
MGDISNGVVNTLYPYKKNIQEKGRIIQTIKNVQSLNVIGM